MRRLYVSRMTSPDLQRILYVDDDPDLREIVTMSLQDLGGFDLQACASGSEAIEKAPAFDPQLILLDVMMPSMDGPTTLAALRRDPRLAKTVVVFITAKAQAREVAHLMDLGVVDVIAKPFDPMHLHERINAIWENCCGAPGASVADRQVTG